MHFDPDSGADLSIDEPAAGRERCVRACYDCLLSYGNQRVHEMINRHLVRDLMLRLTVATVNNPAAQRPEPSADPLNPRAAEFVAWLRSRDLRLPDTADSDAEGTRPDLIYYLPDGNAAVFVAGPARTATTGPAGTRTRGMSSAISAGASSSWAPEPTGPR